MKHKIPLSAFYLSLTCGCATYTISMVHTEGVASDVVDDTKSTSTSVDTQADFN